MTQDQIPPDQEPKTSSLEEQHAEQSTPETSDVGSTTAPETESTESVNGSPPSESETSKQIS